MAEHRTYCRICPVLCGLVVTIDGDRVVQVRGDRDHPITKGYCCPKGRALGAFHHHPDRLDVPLRRPSSDVPFEPQSWDAILDDIESRLTSAVDESGPDAVAFYAGTWSWFDALGRRTLDRLFDRIGSRSRYTALTVDAVVRSYVSERMSGVAALIPQLDPDSEALTLLVGTNPVISHGHSSAIVDPVSRLRRLATQGGVWVVDPVRTETARLATRHLAPRPGTDAALIAHVVRELLRDGADRAYLDRYAEGVDELERAVAPFTADLVSARTGLDRDDLRELVTAIRRSGRVTALSGTGITMSSDGILTEWLLWSLHVITGSWEQPGGPWCNPGYTLRLDLREPGAQATESGPSSRPDLVGRFGERPCAALADEIEAGNIRVLIVLGGNPATSLPDAERFAAATRRLDALVVADVIESDTARLATHVLPVAGQLERTDTTTLVELFSPVMAAQHTPPVVSPGGSRRVSWRLFADLAERLGHSVLPEGIDHRLSSDDEMVAALVRRSTSNFDGFTDGATVLVADDERPRGWLHERVLARRRWQLAPPELVARLAALREPPPLVFTPRRTMRRMNSALRDVHAPGGKLDPTHVWVHPDDAAATDLLGCERVIVRSAVGEIVAPLRITDDVRPGTVSVPHGLGGSQNVSRLTTGAEGTVEPLTGMVAQSGVAVSITRAS